MRLRQNSVRADDSQSPSRLHGAVVIILEIFSLDRFREQKMRNEIEAHSKLEIKLGGTLLQKLEIHTSCSKSIAEGDQFGSLILRQFVPE